MARPRLLFLFLFAVLVAPSLFCQDSVDVTFHYSPPQGAGTPYLVGEFNSWNNSAWPMTPDGTSWLRTARLRIGGNPTPPSNGVPGAWQYKFYYAGVATWPSDPLDHHRNPADNTNSFIITKDPTVYQLLPNQLGPILKTDRPLFSAYIFPKVGAEIDTAALSISLDGTNYTGIGNFYDFGTRKLSFQCPASLPNGQHTLILHVASTAGGANADTVTFYTQAGYVQITSRGGYATQNPLKTVRGSVADTAVHVARVVRNGADTTIAVVTGGKFVVIDTLTEGVNIFRAIADSLGTPAISEPVSFTYLVNHTPSARVDIAGAESSVNLGATGSTDPDSSQTATLSFVWLERAGNPSSLGIQGTSSSVINIAKPSAAGEYFVGLVARDVDGHADTTWNYFTITVDGQISVPTIASSPSWVGNGRIYFLFPKAASSAGTIAAASALLPHIKSLGFSIIWMMPVMKNAYPIDNGTGTGYNIVDFYTVAPEYGTNQDLKNFVSSAHALGLKVILDITPNHTSRFHPWSVDAHTFKEDSQYWTWYEHSLIPHNTNGLGQSLDADGFNYYSGFSDQLLNYNWRDVDARAAMIDVYKYWIKEFDVDGYRFDVYWGPHRRYGEAAMGHPVREALKHIKPDIFLLGEDDGTGPGTETIYADYSSGGIHGGLDASYDFKLYFNQIRGFTFLSTALNSLHTEIDNGGYYPGPHALYMRFMESQDEDRITYFYSNNLTVDATTTFKKTMPMASVVFTAPGIPMLWNGQEVGWGYGISNFDSRRRGVINWAYQGKDLLSPHYQKLALIRGQFPAFTQHKRDTNGDGAVTSSDSSDFIRVPSSNGIVYAFARPWTDDNGVTVVNFTGSDQSALLNLSGTGILHFTGGTQSGTLYYLNNLYDNTRSQVYGSDLDSINVALPAYGTAIFTVSTSPDTLKIAEPLVAVTESHESVPTAFSLEQNYPNPFNPVTQINYTLRQGERESGGVGEGGRSVQVQLVVYDILGRQVAMLVNEAQAPGRYTARFNGSNLASGVYLYRLSAGSFVQTKRMLLLK